MAITEKESAKIEKYLPKQRGNVRIQNLQWINALLEEIQRAQEQKYLWMDRAYEGENVRDTAVKKDL